MCTYMRPVLGFCHHFFFWWEYRMHTVSQHLYNNRKRKIMRVLWDILCIFKSLLIPISAVCRRLPVLLLVSCMTDLIWLLTVKKRCVVVCNIRRIKM